MNHQAAYKNDYLQSLRRGGNKLSASCTTVEKLFILVIETAEHVKHHRRRPGIMKKVQGNKSLDLGKKYLISSVFGIGVVLFNEKCSDDGKHVHIKVYTICTCYAIANMYMLWV